MKRSAEAEPRGGTPTTVDSDIMAMAIDSDMAMVAMDSDMVATTVAIMVWDTGAARRGLLRLNLYHLLILMLILMLTPGIDTDTMAVLMPAMDMTATDLDTTATVAATDTATGARPSARSSDDISYD